MPRPVPGPEALVSYIRTGDRGARIAYRDLPDAERLAYRDTVRRVYDRALARHLGEHPSEDRVEDLVERIAARHPQYAGGVKRVLRSLAEGWPNGGIDPRRLLTAQHLVIREIAKLHPDFRDRADRIVADAVGTPAAVGTRSFASRLDDGDSHARERAERRAPSPDAEFTGADPKSLASVTLAIDGSMRALELLRGAERLGGRSIGMAVVRAWVAAEKQRWPRAKELGVHDWFPEIGSGAGKGDTFRCEAYSTSRLCRATVDRYGRLRALTFMRAGLFDDGRLALAAEIREAIAGAQRGLHALL